jgi:DNA repair photolyase
MFVRWSNLTLTDEEQRRLPGYRDEAVVRRFDAPEALDIRFYEVRARSVLNRVPERSPMPFRWTVNPYRGCTHACVYCFARPTHQYLDFDAGRDFEREIVVKVNAPEVLRGELARASWSREHVALGTNTDPYQWVEARYRLMPGIWRALLEHRTPCSVLTKSPLLLRDLPLLAELASEGLVSAALSVPTLDERAWRATEPHTPHPAARLDAVRELTRAGVPTSVLVAPLMPGINDDPRLVREIVERARDAGARACVRCSWTGCKRRARSWLATTASSTAAAPTSRRASAGGWMPWCAPEALPGPAARASSGRARSAARSAPPRRRRLSRACSERLRTR